MPRRLRTLPRSSGGGADPRLVISDVDWERTERAFGKRLSADVRKDVHEATKKFVSFELPERTAEPVADAKAIIEACKRGASNFRETLLAHGFKSSDAGVYATHLIKKNFNDPRLSDENNLFGTLGGLLTSFHVACITALKQLNDPSMPSFRSGRAWGRWIRRLTEIMRNNSLPAGVSKDGLSTSAFVNLVWELQQFLPVACRRHTQSKAALAKAIWEERDRPRRQAAKGAKAASRGEV